jgi:hypothetical protein
MVTANGVIREYNKKFQKSYKVIVSPRWITVIVGLNIDMIELHQLWDEVGRTLHYSLLLMEVCEGKLTIRFGEDAIKE